MQGWPPIFIQDSQATSQNPKPFHRVDLHRPLIRYIANLEIQSSPRHPPTYKRLATTLTILLDKFARHPAMEPNFQQTYMTLAPRKNKLCFMYESVGRPLIFLPSLPIYSQNPADPLPNKSYNDILLFSHCFPWAEMS